MTWRAGFAAFLFIGFARATPPSFDVASLKPVENTGGVYRADLGTALHGEVTLTNVTLSDCLRFAYGITNDAQIDGPDWIRSREVRFDIVAKSSPNTPRGQLLLMLQTLLTERFHLVLHRTSKALSFLDLVVAKKGPELRKATNGSDSSQRISIPGKIISNRMTMEVLATLLSRFMRQTVIDGTELTGSYEVNLQWTPENLRQTPRPAGETNTAEPTDAQPGPSIFTAVQEQLGLRLESRKGPLEVLVVDRADQVPAEN